MGQKIETKYIKSKDELARIRSVLSDDKRARLLFEMGIGTGMQLKELLSLRVRDLVLSEDGVRISFGDEERIFAQPELISSLNLFTAMIQPGQEEYLFRKRQINEPISLSAASNTIKGWFLSAGFSGNWSGRSLHKTWAYFNPQESGSKAGPSSVSAQEQVLRTLYREIAQGAIPVGTKLTVADLTKRFEVSTTPIRMALAQLDALGLVESLKKKACVVKNPSQQEIWEIWLIRTALESIAFELAWENWQQDTTERLEKILSRWQNASTREEVMRYHTQFHAALYQDAKAPLILQYVGNLSARMTALHAGYQNVTDHNEGNLPEDDISEHRSILEAIRERNFKKARALLRGSISSGRDNALKHYFMNLPHSLTDPEACRTFHERSGVEIALH